MKIIFEAGDFVTVKDSFEAGRAANCTLRLISKQGTTWKGVVEESFDEVVHGETVSVEEKFLSPEF